MLRKKYKELRAAISIEEHKRRSQSIGDRLINDVDYRESSAVLFFVSFGSEINTLPLIEEAIQEGKRALVPITDTEKKLLRISEIKSLLELTEGAYGIKEPLVQYLRPLSYNEVELVLVPGLVFDELGYRVGYGGGYYDRLLVELEPRARRIGLAFEAQIVERLSLEDHDTPVHKVITEERTISIEEGAQ